MPSFWIIFVTIHFNQTASKTLILYMLDQLTLLERLGVFVARDFIDFRLCR